MKVLLILDFPLQTSHLAKFIFYRYQPKSSWSIRLQHFLKCNISKKLRNQVDFLFMDKHHSFLQGGIIADGGHDQTCSNYPKQQKKRWGIDKIFCMEINKKAFYKLTVSFLLVIARYSQSTQNIKLVISLQYLQKRRER